MEKLYKWIEVRPATHKINFENIRLSVFRHVDCGEKWYLSTTILSIGIVDLKTENLEAAKRGAIAYLRSYLRLLLEDFDNVKYL